jgi:small subunit ribosomal protein S1
MGKRDDFASMLEASLADGSSRAARRLELGQVVEGTVIQIGSDSIFVDVGTPGDGRIARAELSDASGELSVRVGQRLRATVVDPRPDGPVLAIAFGRGGDVQASSLALALESGAPVAGRVTQAVKGGLEVDLGGTRAFCPASQIEPAFVADLEPYVGRNLEFKVMEIRDGGRSVVLSRRARLEEERRERERGMLERLTPGSDLEGVVHAVERRGAVIDLGGVEGFVHVSELAPHRVARPEDVVNVGDPVKVRVLAVEETPKGMRVRLSLKALAQQRSSSAAPGTDEVYDARVVRLLNHGLIVETDAGEGLLPVNELALAPGADHRRAFPVGSTLRVVVATRDPTSGKIRFSATGVAAVEERKNYREFSATGGKTSGGFGSLGDVLRDKLAEPPQPKPKPTQSAAVVRRKRP